MAKTTAPRSEDTKPLIRYRLRARLRNAGFPEPEQIATMVATWLEDCAKQVGRDGHRDGRVVISEVARTLREGQR